MTLGEDLRLRDEDAREDNRTMCWVLGVLGGVLSVLAALQAVLALGMLSQTVRGVEGGPVLDIVVRVLVNFTTITLAVALVGALRPERHGRRRRWLVTALLAVIVALVRSGLQIVAGVYPHTAYDALAIEVSVGSTVVALMCGFGFLLVRSTRRVREKEREHARVLVQAVDALQALQQEELRVRREVALDLHGRLQNTLVVLAAEIRAIASAPKQRERLEAVAARLDGLREHEIRAASGALYPADVEHGLVPAVRDLVARLPPEIAVDLQLDEGFAALEAQSIPVDHRVMLVRTIEEALTNALKHGGARAVRLRLEAEQDPDAVITMALDDDGRGLVPEPRRSGLDRLAHQFALYGGSLELLPSEDLGGARLSARLPLRPAA